MNEVFDVVEVCPHCECENIFENWYVEKQGYVATCQHCGKPMMLCDECKHWDDNPDNQEYPKCDWHRETIDNVTYSVCFRGKYKEVILI